jgi:hypothetical protein
VGPFILPQNPPAVVDIAGNLDCIINCDQLNDGYLRVGGSVLPRSRIRVGGALWDLLDMSSIIRIGAADGLKGQAIINGLASVIGDQFLWPLGASVQVGPPGSAVPLNLPNYPNTSTSLGGGSVGLVPYRVHDQDSVPANSNDPEAAGIGVFRVTPVAGRLVCDDEGGLIASATFDVKPFVDYFQLVPDCNGNRIPDPQELGRWGRSPTATAMA